MMNFLNNNDINFSSDFRFCMQNSGGYSTRKPDGSLRAFGVYNYVLRVNYSVEIGRKHICLLLVLYIWKKYAITLDLSDCYR